MNILLMKMPKDNLLLLVSASYFQDFSDKQ